MPEKKPENARRASRKTVDGTAASTKAAKATTGTAVEGLTANAGSIEKVLEAATEARFQALDSASDQLANVLSPKSFMADMMTLTAAKLQAEQEEIEEEVDLEAQLKNAFGAFNAPTKQAWVIESAPEQPQLSPVEPKSPKTP